MSDLEFEPDEFDAYLTTALDAGDLPDAGFSRAIEDRLARSRRRRRLVLSAGWTLAAAVGALVPFLSPGSNMTPTLSPQEITAAMLLAALCAFVLIETESRHLDSNA